MIKIELPSVVAGMASIIVFTLTNPVAHAVSITVDGNLSDIIAEVGTTNVVNFGYGDDPLGSADSPATESNNGFDIDKVYARFDVANDVLYLGMSVYGEVGDSRPITDTTSTNEYLNSCSTTYCNRNVFDSNEQYGVQLYFGTSTSDPQLLRYYVAGVNNGTDAELGSNLNPYGLTITRAISESNNGVEFSIAGLLTKGAIPYVNNQDLLVRFTAGSGDPVPPSSGAEDAHNLQMQVVPVPAAVWLFGSGLIGLIGVARRRCMNK